MQCGHKEACLFACVCVWATECESAQHGGVNSLENEIVLTECHALPPNAAGLETTLGPNRAQMGRLHVWHQD